MVGGRRQEAEMKMLRFSLGLTMDGEDREPQNRGGR